MFLYAPTCIQCRVGALLFATAACKHFVCASLERFGALSAPGGTHSSHKAAIIQFAATVEAITAQDSLRVDGLDGLSGQARPGMKPLP